MLLLIYGFTASSTGTPALVAAVAHVAATYPAMNDLVLALNDFVW